MAGTSAEKNKNGDVIVDLMDNFGRFQLIQYVLICLPLFMVSMTHVNYIFVAGDVEYRCKLPECESVDPTTEIPTWWPQTPDTKCLKPVLDVNKYSAANQTCSNTTFLGILEACDEWIYENNNSIVAELNLGCQPWKATLVGSIHNAGMIVSMLFTGWIADKFGRKPTTILCSVGGVIGVFKIFLTDYYAYVTIEFLESLLASGLYTVAIVLMIEVGGDSKRVLAAVIFSYAVYIGEMVFALAAMWLQYWKYLILVVYTPMFLFIIYICLLAEGTRWQILRGKITEAKETFKIIARNNKLHITAKEIEEMTDKEIRERLSIQEQREKESIKDILSSREIIIRLAVTSFCFFTSSFLYYGSMVHAVLLPGNKYTNFVLSSLTSFPGDMLALYTFNKYGRRITLQYGYIVSAVFLLAQAFAPESMSWLKIGLFLVGKLGVVVCFTGIYTYSLELFPTSVRGSLVGCGNTVARVGSMLAPLTPLLVTEMSSLPSILFSSCAVVSALLLIFTPETKNLPMFDTIQQVEAYKHKATTHL